jgi:hypothetical protein
LLQSAHEVEKNAQRGLLSATYRTVARDGRCKELYQSRRQSFLLNWVLMHLYYVLTYYGIRFGSSPGTSFCRLTVPPKDSVERRFASIEGTVRVPLGRGQSNY